MSAYIFLKSTDDMFAEFDNYEIWPCTLLDPTNPKGGFDRCEPDDPELGFWSVFGHLGTGGLECISDHETFEEAYEYMETLPKRHFNPLY